MSLFKHFKITAVSVVMLCKTLRDGPVCAMQAWIHTLAAQSQMDTSGLNVLSQTDWQRNVSSLDADVCFLVSLYKISDVWSSLYGVKMSFFLLFSLLYFASLVSSYVPCTSVLTKKSCPFQNCLYNTAGDRCERCKEGYYGNPAQRTCRVCPCPFSVPTNK